MTGYTSGGADAVAGQPGNHLRPPRLWTPGKRPVKQGAADTNVLAAPTIQTGGLTLRPAFRKLRPGSVLLIAVALICADFLLTR